MAWGKEAVGGIERGTMVYSFTLAGTRLLDFVAGAIVCVCVVLWFATNYFMEVRCRKLKSRSGLLCGDIPRLTLTNSGASPWWLYFHGHASIFLHVPLIQEHM